MTFRFLIISFVFAFSTLFSQKTCKKFVLKSCINHEALLHIKNGVLTWEIKEKYAPGEHFECGSVGITRINGTQWKDSRTAFKLDFNTNGLNVFPVVHLKNNISELIQKPTEENEWETIWRFYDPADLPHSYSISFKFCPLGVDPNPKKTKLKIKEDTVKAIKSPVKVANKIEYTEDIICNVNFEGGKKTLTKSSESELSKLSEILKMNNLLIEISGYKSSDLKLFNDRSVVIDTFLVNKGIDQKRIKFIGYGASDKKQPTHKIIKCCIIIN